MSVLGNYTHRPLRVIVAAVVIIGVGIIGAALLHFSRAATPFVQTEPELGTSSNGATVVDDTTASNGKAVKFGAQLPPAPPPPPPVGSTPYGYADYCSLEGTNTVVYGWASDPNATATSDPNVTVVIDSKSVTVPTNVAGYRDVPINAWIDAAHPGEAKPGIYGYKAVMGAFSKGMKHTISGTVINVGAGANAVMGINKSGSLDGAAISNFIGGYLPDQCLGGAGPAITKACGNRQLPPAKYDHVIWIYEENHRYSQVINTSAAPYMTSLAKSCGTSTKFTDSLPVLVLHPNLRPGDSWVAHSSLVYPTNIHGGDCVYGNGISGTKCYESLSGTEKVNLPWRTILDQLNEKSMTWKAYEENMPSNCYGGDAGVYHNDHNPIFRLSSVRSQCAANDVKIPGISCPDSTSSCSAPNNVFITALNNGTMPNFVQLIPNVDNMMHDGTVRQADNWLKMYVGKIVSSAEYKKGKTAIFVLWDEPASTSDPNMPFLAISPSTTTGISTTTANGYAVLRATEQMFGITEYLGCASGTPWHATGQAAPAGSSCFPGATTDVRKLYNL